MIVFLRGLGGDWVGGEGGGGGGWGAAVVVALLVCLRILMLCGYMYSSSFCRLQHNFRFPLEKHYKHIQFSSSVVNRPSLPPSLLPLFKCDMLTDAADSFLAGANMVAMCHEQKFASWYVTSAKSGSNVDDAFLDLVERAMEEKEEEVVGLGGEKKKEGGERGGKGEGAFKLSAVEGGEGQGGKGGGRAFGWSMC